MAEIPEFERRNVTRTVDDLGIETSRRFAEADQLRRETDKYLKPGRFSPASTEIGSIQSTPTKSEELLGIVAQGRYAIFPQIPEPKTRITALSEGRLATSIGEGADLLTKIKNAPKELKDERSTFSAISKFADAYGRTDKDCSHIYLHSKEFNKG